MYTQQDVSNHLRSQPAPHRRDEMTRPDLEYQVSYDSETVSQAGYEYAGGEFRADGRLDSRKAPAPLRYATIGSNGRSTDGRIHFIGLDIDGANHSAGHAADTLNQVIEKLNALPQVQVNRSRSNRGYHVYIFPARELVAETNSVMYGYGKAVKDWIAERIGDERFSTIVDCAGSMLFFHSPNVGERGYELIKPATQLFTDPLEPVCDAGESKFAADDLKDLEPEHRRFVAWVEANHKKDFIKKSETLFRGHTFDIAAAHKALNLKGEFTTVATGSGDTKWNCWMRAITGGGWIVGQWGTSSENWTETSSGKYTLLNVAPTLKEFAATHVLGDRQGKYGMTPEQAAELCRLCGVVFPATEATYVQATEAAGQLQFEVDYTKGAKLVAPWQQVTSRKAGFTVAVTDNKPNPADRIRVAYSPGGKDFAVYRRVFRDWHETNPRDAATRLRLLGLSPIEIDGVLSTDTPFKIVAEPFKGEFTSRYEWNRGAVQLAFPVGDVGAHPHWDMILNHCGVGLTEAVANDIWCQVNGLKTGADYLRLWAARMFRFPKQRLPGLAFYSPDQNCGKSTFFAAHGKLMTAGGYVSTPSPLTTNFNGPLLGCVLWDLDDVDLSQRSGELYRKLQPLMTNDELVVEFKGANPLSVTNCLHIGHTANQLECYAIQPGDTRWVIILVGFLEHEIPAAAFTRALMREAPHYLRTLFDLPMPTEAAGRMFLPVLDTPIKNQLMYARSGGGLDTDQNQWFKRIVALANDNRLTQWVTFDELKQLVALPDSALTSRGLGMVWPTFAAPLQAMGFNAVHRKNNGGSQPAAWRVYTDV